MNKQISKSPVLNEILASARKAQQAACDKIRLQRERDDLLKALKIADSIIHNFTHAAKRGIVPDMSIGDFRTIDSIKAAITSAEGK